DGREAEADLGDGLDERLQELGQGRLTPGASPGITHTRSASVGINPGLAPGVSEAPVLSVRADVYAGEHDLPVILRQGLCFGDQLRDRPRPVRAAGERRRAARAVLVAAVLDLDTTAGVGLAAAQHAI